MPRIVVRPGDCFESIAMDSGHFWETVWNHPENASLRELRADHATLLPGDDVFVPDLRSKEVSAETGKRHRFRRKGVPSRLKIRFLDEAGEPRTDAWRLEIDGAVLEGKLGDGWIDQPLSPRARSGRLVLIGPPLEGEDQPHEDVHELALGYLDPIDTPSGVQGWLANLGLYDGPIDGNESEELEDAVARFQALHELDPTGVIDEATRSALADAGRG